MASPRSTAAPPHTGTRIDRIGVVVPVNNEEHGLRQRLAALDEAASSVAVPVTVIVVLDSCTDDSAAVVNGFSGGHVESLAAEFNNVGVARAAGMAVLLHRHPESGTWLATTDGDSIVPRHWLAAQVRHAAAGARVVAGTVTVQDWEERGSILRERVRRDYRAGPHRHVHGANLSFAADAYRAAGGFDPVTADEDVRLMDAFRANGESITWATDLAVVTSARRHARVPQGFASYLSALEDSSQFGMGSAHAERTQTA
jgi:cellulose synthase/poly-beta-1,6-N-acetylglucosamine synthase-like glycosyltransferase